MKDAIPPSFPELAAPSATEGLSPIYIATTEEFSLAVTRMRHTDASKAIIDSYKGRPRIYEHQPVPECEFCALTPKLLDSDR